MKTKIFILLFSIILTSCSEKYVDGTRSDGIKKSDAGAMMGGVAGGVVGHQFGNGAGNTASTIGGVAIGALAGHAIGLAMDEPVNKAQYAHINARPANVDILQYTLENNKSGEASELGSYKGQTVKIIPTNTFTNQNGQNCRSYKTIPENGATVINGYACRDANGNWS